MHDKEEVLYNGITLPAVWPPQSMDPSSLEPMRVPYLDQPPDVIPIDVGRQLFVDDFLVEQTTLKREFHQPSKYEGNPVLSPETEMELNGGVSPVACPFGDGVFYDPQDELYKLWYHAGWYDGTALATSSDGFHWTRPQLDVVPGTNRVLPIRADYRRDGVSVWLDYDTPRTDERYKMFLYARSGASGTGGRLYTSPDGIHWKERARTGRVGDNTSLFYNPFRRKWVLSIRTGRPARTRDYLTRTDFPDLASWERARDYLERTDFLDLANRGQDDAVYWCGTDRFDLPDAEIGRPPQLYKVEATPYESLMLGLMQIHHGPPNEVCAAQGFPKTTHLEVAFSRDGFHWHRPGRNEMVQAVREPQSPSSDSSFFIPATRCEGDWDRGYIHAATGGCVVIGDELLFYYSGWSGKSPRLTGAMYAGGSTGVALLRRDGFASMDACGIGGVLTTRPLSFEGRYLFVNLDAPDGELRVELLDAEGCPIEPFTADMCLPLCDDSTSQAIVWQAGADISLLAGQPVRFRFHLREGSLYAFWVSPDSSGASYGYVAAGGAGFQGPVDTVGR